MKTIDCTPTWAGLMPAMFNLLENPKTPEESKKIVRGEIMKLAREMDKHIAEMKKEKAAIDAKLK